MRIAICFYGQPRRYKEVLNDWKHVINETNADVFIHTWSGKDRIGNDIDVNELINDYNPKEIQVSNLHKFLSLIPEKYNYQNQSYHVMQRTYSSTISFNILNQYSRDFKKEYDLVIETRLDVKLHNFDKFIFFIKNIKKDDFNLYVCMNHWYGHTEFDDAIMVGNNKVLSPLWLNAFSNTIDFINKTSVIPANEYNLTRYVIDSNLYDNIKRVSEMNYDLLSLQTSISLVDIHQNI
jgi:hypothetical protein